MKIHKIDTNRIITPKTTGYAATTTLALSLLSGVTKNRTFRKTHKPLAYLSALFTIMHIGLIEYYHQKYKKM